jgi:hypothetical protein
MKEGIQRPFRSLLMVEKHLIMEEGTSVSEEN